VIRRAALMVAFLALPGLGCALLSKDQPTLLRYYSLDSPRRSQPQGSIASPKGTAPTPMARLRVGRISAALYIRERMAFRESGFEIGFYDDFRWTERPESYVRRDLARALFEDEGVEEVVGGAGLTLDVDIDSFEEVRDRHAAVVQLSWQLRDDMVVLQRRTVTVERPLGQDAKDGSSHMALAIALSGAMEDAIHRLVGEVLPRLSGPTGTASVGGSSPVRLAQ
jgi:ABC-type uncharacterized transport system auxiliary subunit